MSSRFLQLWSVVFQHGISTTILFGLLQCVTVCQEWFFWVKVQGHFLNPILCRQKKLFTISRCFRINPLFLNFPHHFISDLHYKYPHKYCFPSVWRFLPIIRYFQQFLFKFCTPKIFSVLNCFVLMFCFNTFNTSSFTSSVFSASYSKFKGFLRRKIWILRSICPTVKAWSTKLNLVILLLLVGYGSPWSEVLIVYREVKAQWRSKGGRGASGGTRPGA